MKNSNLIAIQTFCHSHGIDTDFIYSIYEIGIIELVKIDNDEFIEESQLSDLEKTLRLHKELHINNEGIAVVFDLLKQMDSLHTELNALRNRLEIYEDPSAFQK